ncbi:MAG: methyl-accepting chemotaxis protein [Pseudomonadota bacterium]
MTAFVFVALIGAAIGLAGAYGMSRMGDMVHRLYALELIGVSQVKEANVNLVAAGRARWQFMAAATEAERVQRAREAKAHATQLRHWLDKTRPLLHKEVGRRKMAEVIAAFEAWEPAADAFFAAALAGSAGEELQRLNRELSDKNDQLDQRLAEMSRIKERVGEQTALDSQALHGWLSQLVLALAVGGTLAGLAFGVLLSRSVGRQLGGEPRYGREVAERIAHGDLSTAIHVQGDDAGSMLGAMKTMQQQLAQIVQRIRSTAEGVSTASGQIAAGNLDLSSRTEQQASSLQQTAASMEQLTSTVQQNAESARQGSQLAASASEVARDGGRVVAEVVSTMNEISHSSGRITEIIQVIDSIAFQTNILALNASVEAARAGVQGRGFAVVATEVRALAQRSAEAARQIKTLITASAERVNAGTRLVDQAGQRMRDIVGAIHRVADITGQIAAATVQQSAGITQVCTAVSQMDPATQQNAALVEQSASAADSLNAQAEALLQAVSVFRLAERPQAV